MISLNKQSAIPIYRQLADVLRSQVLKGELKSGDQLPSEFDLVEKYAVSRSSVRHAIDLLVREGFFLIYNRLLKPDYILFVFIKCRRLLLRIKIKIRFAD